MNINYKHTNHTHNPTSAEIILPFVFKIANPHSVLDVGCGNGSWLKVCKDLGVNDIYGVDGIQVSNNDLMIERNKFFKYDLTKKLDLRRKFDLVLSLEVAEHLPAIAADNFVDTLTQHASIILFSAAIPLQGGQYHLNEQWPNYWNEKFKKRGFEAFDILRGEFWNNDKVLWWYRQNIVLYARKGEMALNNFKSTQEVMPYIHPSLYQKKVFKPQYLHSKKEVFKSILKTFKYLLRN